MVDLMLERLRMFLIEVDLNSKLRNFKLIFGNPYCVLPAFESFFVS
jgi:hypothetical protein